MRLLNSLSPPSLIDRLGTHEMRHALKSHAASPKAAVGKLSKKELYPETIESPK